MLIVDDSAYMRTLIKMSIEDQPVLIVGETNTGHDGFRKYKELMPDIVTMDLIMDDGDGLEALRDIIEFNPKACVIIISSIIGQETLVAEALRLGARNIFDKISIRTRFADYIKEITKE
jgi:two-component system chemotaxis response regulator CheY